VGRARHQAGTLSAELRQVGAQVIEIPFIEIRQPKSFQPLDRALKNLGTYDWLILTSVNGVEVLWQRIQKLGLWKSQVFVPQDKKPRIAAIGPATSRAIEQRGLKVDVVPKEYVAESIVRSLKKSVAGNRVLLVRARIARDVIPRELRKAGAQVDVVEAYETVVPPGSRRRLEAALKNPKRRPDIVTFTSSSTVRNFVELLGGQSRRHARCNGIRMASIGPVTSSTLRELGLKPDIQAREYTIPGLVKAIVRAPRSAPSPGF
jgi:uroporphyrinogen-III synthase